MLGFKPFPLDRRTEDDLPQHIKGAARWHEEEDEEGYWVNDLLSQEYRAIEYDEDTKQWYFCYDPDASVTSPCLVLFWLCLL